MGRQKHYVFSLLYFNLFPFLNRLEESIVGNLASVLGEGGREEKDR